MKKYLIHLMFLSAFVLTATVDAQTIGGANAFLFRPVGVRALGLGGSLVSDAVDASALYWNPAGLGSMTNVQLTSSISILPYDQHHNFLAVGIPVANGVTVSGGWLNYTIGNIDGRDDAGVALGEFSSADNAFLLGCGVMIPIVRNLSGVQFGVTGKYISSSVDTYSATGFGVDAGMRLFYNQFAFGASLQNIGATLSWDTESKREDEVPMAIRIGASHEFAITQLRTQYSARVVVEGAKVGDATFGFLGGVETKVVFPSPRTSFALRAGYGRDLWSGGITVEFNLERATAVGHEYAATQDYLAEQLLHHIGLHIVF